MKTEAYVIYQTTTKSFVCIGGEFCGEDDYYTCPHLFIASLYSKQSHAQNVIKDIQNRWGSGLDWDNLVVKKVTLEIEDE
jgi:hypothetical protein